MILVFRMFNIKENPCMLIFKTCFGFIKGNAMFF